MTTRTEQETRQAPSSTPARGAVPKTVRRRPEVPHPAKPVPQPRPETDRRRPRPEPGALRGRPETTGRPATERPRPAAQRRPARQRAPFVLLVVGLLCGGLVSLLLLNTVLAQDSITASTLMDEISAARLQNEDLKRQLEQDKQPAVIAKHAEDLGMEPALDSVNPYTTGDTGTGSTGTTSTEPGRAVQGR
ncbi:hypothetical protein [Nonomuraea sp. LPB2021202275-12-8]|uniref:hypothetical protein n=1 Tax=Nonomuraea sp. LPB2021202275-12-8 TaxID=3120159 RepID=UPI00300C3142